MNGPVYADPSPVIGREAAGDGVPVAEKFRSPGGRIGGLDALRGLAAIGVMLFHYTVLYDAKAGYTGPVAFRFPLGFYGVHLFFLISGFVIFMTVERTKRPIDFVISRFARLYPAYWLAIGLTFVALAIFPSPIHPVPLAQLTLRAIVDLTMCQGWLGIGSIDGVYWTLQIEMTFYAIMIGLLWSRRLDRTIAVLSALVALGVVQSLLSSAYSHPLLERLRGILALDYLHVLTIGVLLYQMRRRHRPRYLAMILLLIFVPFTQHRPFLVPWNDALATTLFAWLVYLATTNRLPWLEHKALTFLGAISYTLYLIHNEIGIVIIRKLDHAGLNHNLSIAATIALAILLASAMSFLCERPSMKAIRRRAERWVGPSRKLAEVSTMNEKSTS